MVSNAAVGAADVRRDVPLDASKVLPVSPSHVTINNETNPLGIDREVPLRFGWHMESQRRSELQTAYRVVVAATAKAANAGTGDVWDSGKVMSSDQTGIPYGGTLAPRTGYFMRVKLWDRDHRETPWSDVATFETAMLSPQDWKAPYASGSAQVDAYVICPCSMGTLGTIASGSMTNLIHRAASVALKEGRKLVLVPRETPLSTIHLQNMLTLRQAGATILFAAPGFYHAPTSIDDLVDFVVARLLDQIGLDNALAGRWGQPE